MKQAVTWLGDGAAVVGVLLCAVAGLARLGGSYTLLSMDAMTVFVGGMGLMLFACLAKLHLLQQR
ncbi:MAG TPA: hypothetical protein VIS52_08990 [Motiliproteus sp.]